MQTAGGTKHLYILCFWLYSAILRFVNSYGDKNVTQGTGTAVKFPISRTAENVVAFIYFFLTCCKG